MKKILLLLLPFLFLGLFLNSCQKEEKLFIDETNDETITANSQLTLLLLRTSENYGVIDDIIDGNSCTSIVYPVTVIANGQQVTLQNEEDLQIVQEIFDQFPNDTDTLEIVFPITLILDDFTQVMVNSEAELQLLIDICESGGGNSAIGCLDFEYPITFFVYDNNQQQTTTVSVNNDNELYLFLDGLDTDDYFSIDYPINVILDDGTVVAVDNNFDLEQLITDCLNNSTNDEPIDQAEFEQYLTDDQWYVTYFFNDFDRTDEFDGYTFEFLSDNTSQATDGSSIIPGTWMFSGGSSPELALFFGTTSPFDELDEDWQILEASNDLIRLRNISGDGSLDYVTYERTPATGSGAANTNTLIEQLITGAWYVTLFEDSGDIETCDYSDFEFTYYLNGSVIGVSTSAVINGYWTVESSGGNLDLILNFDSSGSGNPLGELNDDWNVVAHSIDLISLSDDSGGGGGSDLLEFGRVPAAGCGGGGGGGSGSDPQELRDVMQSGTWYVAQFLDDGADETADFNGYDFTFLANETVSASNGNQTVPGIWIVSVVSNVLNFEFDMDSPLNIADDNDYKVLQFSDVSVTFVTLNNGMIIDTLTFNKN